MRPALPLVVVVALLLVGCGGGGRGSWRTYEDREYGLEVSYPQGWQRATSTLTPFLADPREILSLGTYRLAAGGTRCAQVPERALEELGPTDALISLQERIDQSEYALPNRPQRFGPQHGNETEAGACLERPSRGFLREISFEDEGRLFYAYVAIGELATSETREQVWGILDSLTFRER